MKRPNLPRGGTRRAAVLLFVMFVLSTAAAPASSCGSDEDTDLPPFEMRLRESANGVENTYEFVYDSAGEWIYTLVESEDDPRSTGSYWQVRDGEIVQYSAASDRARHRTYDGLAAPVPGPWFTVRAVEEKRSKATGKQIELTVEDGVERMRVWSQRPCGTLADEDLRQELCPVGEGVEVMIERTFDAETGIPLSFAERIEGHTYRVVVVESVELR